MDERELAEVARSGVDAHLLDEWVAAGVVAGCVHDASLRCRLQHAPALLDRHGERLLANDVEATLDRGERLRGVNGVRSADVEHIDVLALEQRLEVVVRRPPAEGLRSLERP